MQHSFMCDCCRCQVMDSTCVDAHKYLALHALCYEGNAQEVTHSQHTDYTITLLTH